MLKQIVLGTMLIGPVAALHVEAAQPRISARGLGTIKLRAASEGPGAHLMASYEGAVTKLGTAGFLVVVVSGFPAESEFPVLVSGKVIGTISTNKAGEGDVKFRSYAGTPAVLPAIRAGDIIGTPVVKARFR